MPSKTKDQRPLPMFERIYKANVLAPPFLAKVIKIVQPDNATKFAWGCECHVVDQANRILLNLSRGPAEQQAAMEVCTWAETFAAALDVGANVQTVKQARDRIGTGALRLIDGSFKTWEKKLVFELCQDLMTDAEFVKIDRLAPELECRFYLSWPKEPSYNKVFAASQAVDHLRPFFPA